MHLLILHILKMLQFYKYHIPKMIIVHYGCMAWACVMVTGTIITTKMIATNEIMFMRIETPLNTLLLSLSSVPRACNSMHIAQSNCCTHVIVICM